MYVYFDGFLTSHWLEICYRIMVWSTEVHWFVCVHRRGHKNKTMHLVWGRSFPQTATSWWIVWARLNNTDAVCSSGCWNVFHSLEEDKRFVLLHELASQWTGKLAIWRQTTHKQAKLIGRIMMMEEMENPFGFAPTMRFTFYERSFF